MQVVYPKDETIALIKRKYDKIYDADFEKHDKYLDKELKTHSIARRIFTTTLGLTFIIGGILQIIAHINSWGLLSNITLIVMGISLSISIISLAIVIMKESNYKEFRDYEPPFIVDDIDSRLYTYKELIDIIEEFKEQGVKIVDVFKEEFDVKERYPDVDEEPRRKNYYDLYFSVRDKDKHGEDFITSADGIIPETADFSYLDELTEEKIDAIIKEDMELDKGQVKQ